MGLVELRRQVVQTVAVWRSSHKDRKRPDLPGTVDVTPQDRAVPRLHRNGVLTQHIKRTPVLLDHHNGTLGHTLLKTSSAKPLIQPMKSSLVPFNPADPGPTL